ncbi:hypothetical protein RHGRI_005547 [Rhododendron griersonianum]|uniref:Uncharacterized protein n=1 Tax=Rhododendron griersonianum TaxID=479676 RepID=A0AAV6LCP2_9ERIC|nr:hypothetical protein RHGRI_005547 [Rhododendron griersonianum]
MEVREGLRFWKAWLAKGWEMEVMGGLCFWKPWMGIQVREKGKSSVFSISVKGYMEPKLEEHSGLAP